MSEHVDERTGSLERVGERWSRWLANRHSRRSFLGLVGGTSVAFAGAGALYPSLAWGTCVGNCTCMNNNSRSCQDAIGTNACPSNACECGFWDVCACGDDCGGAVTTSPCGGTTPVKRWHDCCVDTASCMPT